MAVRIEWVEEHHHWHAEISDVPGVIFGETLQRVRQRVLQAVRITAEAEGCNFVMVEADGGDASVQAFGDGVRLDVIQHTA